MEFFKLKYGETATVRLLDAPQLSFPDYTIHPTANDCPVKGFPKRYELKVYACVDGKPDYTKSMMIYVGEKTYQQLLALDHK